MKPNNPYHRPTFKINTGIYANLQEKQYTCHMCSPFACEQVLLLAMDRCPGKSWYLQKTETSVQMLNKLSIINTEMSTML